MQCGDKEATTANRFRAVDETSDGSGTLQVTLFTKELQKILKTLEWNTLLEAINSLNLNKSLQTLTAIAAIKPTSSTYKRQTSNIYSLLSLYSLSQKQTSTPTLNRKLKVEEDSHKKKT